MRISSMFYQSMIVSLLLFVILPATQAKIIYVDDDAPPPGDGTSWDTAYTYLQDALADANDSEELVEIRVAQGIYRPDQGANQTPGDREATFQLPDGLTLEGGFAGLVAAVPDLRDVEAYETILSGDLASNDADVNDLAELALDPTRAENSHRVVETPETDIGVSIDGVTITAGHADFDLVWQRDSSRPIGGGLWNGGSLTLSNCTFTGNFADEGGAIYSHTGTLTLIDCHFQRNVAAEGGAVYSHAGTLTLIDCRFHRNVAQEKQAFLDDGTVVSMYGRGGAIYADSEMILENCVFGDNLAASGGGMHIATSVDQVQMGECTFSNNCATRVGGGLRNESGGPLSLSGCSFVGNSAGLNGGAVFTRGGTFLAGHCLFGGNLASEGGGGIYAHTTDLTLSNCTAVGNRAMDGNGLALGCFETHPTNIKLIHCILWNGGNQIAMDDHVDLAVAYSDVSGGWPGQGNLDTDPCFVDPGYWDDGGTADDPNDDFFVAGDYHLKSEADRWDPNSGSWVADDVTSPCIDAGDPNSDIGDEVWPHGGRINMGAYGGTAEASMSAEPVDMFLPHIACVRWYDRTLAESCQSFLQAHGCSVTLMFSQRLLEYPLDDYDLILIATDTSSPAVWEDSQLVTALIDTGKPILGLGEGGYRFFGQLGLTIGYPNGASNTLSTIKIVDPNNALFDRPYPVVVPEDGTLQVYQDAVDSAVIYLWPAPETVDPLAHMADDAGYYPLVAEQGHLLWGFTESPGAMTETGKRLFLNAVMLTANSRLEPVTAATP